MKVGSCVNKFFGRAFAESTHYECVCVCQKKNCLVSGYNIQVQTLKACAPTIYNDTDQDKQASTKMMYMGGGVRYDIIIIIIIIIIMSGFGCPKA